MKRIVTIVIEQEVPKGFELRAMKQSTGSKGDELKESIIDVIETEMCDDGTITVDIKLMESNDEKGVV